MTLKVLTYNIHKGFAAGNRRFVLQQIRDSIATVDCDLVFLQEVQGAHSGHAESQKFWPSESQFEFLAGNIWPHFAYGKNAVYSQGHHGNAILSKHGFVSWENIDCSTNALEQRGLLHGVIEVAKNLPHLHVICVHLDLLEKGRRLQIQQICDRVAHSVPADAPLILAGDFNDWNHSIGRLVEHKLDMSEAHKNLHTYYARTFPSRFPLLRLDRIYVRGCVPLACRTLSGSPWNSLSDHSPMLAELKVREIED